VRDHAEAHVDALDGEDRRRLAGPGAHDRRVVRANGLPQVAHAIALAGRDESFIEYVKDRPGHDRRYALDIAKIERELGWSPRHVFEKSLPEVIGWYRENRAWWEPIKSGEYKAYYERQYAARLAAS
jgi:dTDP-glucose 4,6-dehydratase